MSTLKKLIYFTAAAVPTPTEAGHIAIFEAYPGIITCVRNVLQIDDADNPEPADYVANATGSGFPTDYSGYTVATPTNPPAPSGILSTQKVITSGVEFLAPATSGSRVDGWTPTIVAGVVTVLAGS